SRTNSCRCGSEQFIQKEKFPEFTYKLAVLPEQGHLHKIIDTPSNSFNNRALLYKRFDNNLIILKREAIVTSLIENII
ncbi:hypothetical protein ACLIBG_12000, partial [Virgibacillus sp. W0181]|uniref:hypothetical protein n=1 Tax=Virgibacillus sp. W0181 TaxID=3391581 RepID=UPI003F4572FB